MVEQTQPFTRTHSIDTSTDVPLDDVFEALADERRRLILRRLREGDPPVSTGRLARELADDGEAAGSKRELETGLHHRDLPKLDDAGVVTYDPESKLVVDCRVEATEPYLDTAERMER
ncbi:DUF7344 domain-containing protein [Halostella litorea]|uniref:DUF7344 domain-containing protein n=1 Tax=Halostella litorea TaxID=2528831 RepID=UPI001092F609|nr:hypothetical protein [Halostella litorea]